MSVRKSVDIDEPTQRDVAEDSKRMKTVRTGPIWALGQRGTVFVRLQRAAHKHVRTPEVAEGSVARDSSRRAKP
jgi:hypothetical protein